MIRQIRTTAAACVILALASGCSTHQVHPGFKARQSQLRVMTCVPPHVEVYKMGFAKNEPMHDLHPPLIKHTVDKLQDVMEEKGYEWHTLNVPQSSAGQPADLQTAVYAADKIFNKLLEDIAKRRQKTFTYTLGADINPVSDPAGADAVLMVRWEAYKKTGGEIAKDLTKSLLIAAATLGTVIMVAPTSVGVVSIAVVDGSTGDILWYNTNQQDTWVDVAKEDDVRRAIDRTLKPFPLSKELTDRKAQQRLKLRPKNNFATTAASSTPVPMPPPGS